MVQEHVSGVQGASVFFSASQRAIAAVSSVVIEASRLEAVLA